ncbi:hypothetical protein FKG94_03260 [Exilibacterium tricleocarpae]|uniref:Transposase n=1 Tax=Exilibacterium tricleocarpae TaxID=2591008 RepID=A0A545U6X5_9GAMM|nr:hypothetical protein [Exilibacterium tricleocarpae]TQV85222.1 hypothetical protein FKG94_03260 [Exilibacterium tricleocarpae]
MVIVNNHDNLVFDECSPDCHLQVEQSQGQLFAFVQCVDASLQEHRSGKNRGTKRYWGKFDWSTKEESIRAILHYGGKWPTLPKSQ